MRPRSAASTPSRRELAPTFDVPARPHWPRPRRAEAEIAAAHAANRAQQDRWQPFLDAHWQALLGSDPEVVLAALAAAFEDNEAAAAAVGVEDAEVALVVVVPPRMRSRTDGRPPPRRATCR